MTPISFGAAERRLFGIYHAAQMQAPGTRPAVVVCNAFGQEAIRAHRFQRSLAERLARAGHAVLRFDYFGTGDSMGEDADGDLDGWSGDLLTAHGELQRLSGAIRIVWVGMRLGASVALQAAHVAPTGLSRLILWDLILDGTRYLEFLRERHVTSLEKVYSLPLRPAPREVAQDLTCYRDEAIGFAISPLFRSQLSKVSVETHTWPTSPVDIHVVTDPTSPEGKDFAQVQIRDPDRVRVYVVNHGTNWTTDTAGNTPLVPTNALMTITQQVGETA
jgi:uncharacterized protein